MNETDTLPQSGGAASAAASGVPEPPAVRARLFPGGRLIIPALHTVAGLPELEIDPHRPYPRHLPELEQGFSGCHLANSRDRVDDDRVKQPRHFILYRSSDDLLDGLRILHDSRDLTQQLPDGYSQHWVYWCGTVVQ